MRGVRGLWIRKVFCTAQRQSLLQTSHDTILSYCQATLLHVVYDAIHHFTEIKLFMYCIYSFILYLCLIALCVLTVTICLGMVQLTFEINICFSLCTVST